MIHIKLDNSDFKKLGSKMLQLHHIKNDNKLLNSIGILLSAQGKKNITEASPDGLLSYALLKPITLKQKRKKKYSSAPLIRTGNLRKSINYEVCDKLYLTALSYAKHHQYGAQKNNLTSRPIFSIRESNSYSILNYIKKAINRIFKK